MLLQLLIAPAVIIKSTLVQWEKISNSSRPPKLVLQTHPDLKSITRESYSFIDVPILNAFYQLAAFGKGIGRNSRKNVRFVNFILNAILEAKHDQHLAEYDDKLEVKISCDNLETKWMTKAAFIAHMRTIRPSEALSADWISIVEAMFKCFPGKELIQIIEIAVCRATNQDVAAFECIQIVRPPSPKKRKSTAAHSSSSSSTSKASRMTIDAYFISLSTDVDSNSLPS